MTLSHLYNNPGLVPPMQNRFLLIQGYPLVMTNSLRTAIDGAFSSMIWDDLPMAIFDSYFKLPEGDITSKSKTFINRPKDAADWIQDCEECWICQDCWKKGSRSLEGRWRAIIRLLTALIKLHSGFLHITGSPQALFELLSCFHGTIRYCKSERDSGSRSRKI